jgi:hypothetical protein
MSYEATMADRELPALPRELEGYLDHPYGGLFGDSVHSRVVEEIIADPYRDYRPKELVSLTETSAPAVRKALATLKSLGLLFEDRSDRQHPIYKVNLKSKKFVALTLLSFAVLDDRDGSDCMNDAVLSYCNDILPEKGQPVAIATATTYIYKGLSATDFHGRVVKRVKETVIGEDTISMGA